MRIAQQLYEGIDIKGTLRGTIGIITYLRTDSTRISEAPEASARDISQEPMARNTWRTEKKKDGGKKIQDAMRRSVRRIYPRLPAMVKSLSEISSVFIS